MNFKHNDAAGTVSSTRESTSQSTNTSTQNPRHSGGNAPQQQQPQQRQQQSQMVFALWGSPLNLGKFYYPATIVSDLGTQVQVAFLDGAKGTVAKANIVDLETALNTMNIESNWENGGIYYKAVITNRNPLTVRYTMDGVVEQINMVQLRGKRK